MPAHIDPETGHLVGIDVDAPHPRAEIDNLNVRCPGCGGPVVIDTYAQESLEGRTGLVMIGQTRCARRCRWSPGSAS